MGFLSASNYMASTRIAKDKGKQLRQTPNRFRAMTFLTENDKLVKLRGIVNVKTSRNKWLWSMDAT
jgi:hypothetical protein